LGWGWGWGWAQPQPQPKPQPQPLAFKIFFYKKINLKTSKYIY